MTKIVNWSFSVIKDFETCPRKYYEEKVLKTYPFVQNEAARYGNEVHKALENYVKHDADLGEHRQFQKYVDVLKNMPGEKLTEHKMVLTPEKEPTTWFGKRVWVRGQSDLTILHGSTAWVTDYKTGSDKYPDIEQLEVMALLTWRLFPNVEKVKGALVFLVKNNMVKASFTRAEDEDRLWEKWEAKVKRLEKAHESKKFPPKQNGLCRNWCPVQHCEFNGD